MKEQVTCSICGAKMTEETAHEFDGQILCGHCLVEKTTICECCNNRIWREDAENDGYTSVCLSCYENSYARCGDCNHIIYRDDAYYDNDTLYCDECYSKLEDKPIHTYDYKPEPIFYGLGSLYYGVELEIDKGGECNDNAEILLDTANADSEQIYCKHDGSIINGFEIVSHPMTLDYHTNQMNWLDVFNKAIEMDYRSHNTTTCGLHIHVNRSAFGSSNEEQEDVISRIVYFVENHWNELVKFSRRTEGNLNHWASRYGIAATAKDTYKKAKDKRLGRYVAVNLENYYTVEFRIFRGTLRYKTFLAALQLVDEICCLAIMLDDRAFERMSWSQFAANISHAAKPELVDYLKSKRLYVNELTEESEEM